MSAAKKLMVIGAHPDDAEFHAGGFMCHWRELGHDLHILSLTDGGAGHQNLSRSTLTKRRQQEAQQAADILNAGLTIWPEFDGLLESGLPQRLALIRAIRTYAPDLIITHRHFDYHPDHRATATLVRDATYLLQVPNVVDDVPVMRQLPAVLLMADDFEDPRPFRADYILDTSPYLARIVELLHCHVSQVYEWLPHTMQIEVPSEDRIAWLTRWYQSRPRRIAAKHAGQGIAYAEAFEASAYGRTFQGDEFGL